MSKLLKGPQKKSTGHQLIHERYHLTQLELLWVKGLAQGPHTWHTRKVAKTRYRCCTPCSLTNLKLLIKRHRCYREIRQWWVYARSFYFKGKAKQHVFSRNAFCTLIGGRVRGCFTAGWRWSDNCRLCLPACPGGATFSYGTSIQSHVLGNAGTGARARLFLTGAMFYLIKYW